VQVWAGGEKIEKFPNCSQVNVIPVIFGQQISQEEHSAVHVVIGGMCWDRGEVVQSDCGENLDAQACQNPEYNGGLRHCLSDISFSLATCGPCPHKE
jgi:hypothetical protein